MPDERERSEIGAAHAAGVGAQSAAERKGRRGWLLFAVALLVLLLDQLTKFGIRALLVPGQSVPAEGPFRLTYVTNTGAAFGLFPNQSVVLALVGALVIGIILFYHRYLAEDGLVLKISLGLQLGGAIGNLIDRVRYGHVTDFLDFRVWPVFNVADSAIVVGVVLLAYFLFFLSKRGPASS